MNIEKLLKVNPRFVKIMLDKLDLDYVLSFIKPGDKDLAQYLHDLRYLKLADYDSSRGINLYNFSNLNGLNLTVHVGSCDINFNTTSILNPLKDFSGLNLIGYTGSSYIMFYNLSNSIDFSTLDLTGYTGNYKILLVNFNPVNRRHDIFLEINKDNYLEMIKKHNLKYIK